MPRIVIIFLQIVALNLVNCQLRDLETTTENCDYSHCVDVMGNVCSNNGMCNCEQCECEYPYVGRYCERSESRGDCDPHKCMDDNGNICNNRGTCNCDTCECSDSYTGPKCEVTPENVEQVCKRVWNCVLCNGETADPRDVCRNCVNAEKVRIVKVRDVLDLLERKGLYCSFNDKNTCLQNFRVTSAGVNGTRVVYVSPFPICDLMKSSTEYSVERRKSHRGDSPIEPEAGSSLDSSQTKSRFYKGGDNEGDNDNGASVSLGGQAKWIAMLSLATMCFSIVITT